MSTKLKVLAFTGIRSDYDLLYEVYQKVNSHEKMELNLIVSGAHLSHSYGHSVDLIERDKFKILAKIETLLDSDTPSARIKSGSILMQGCLPFVESFNPDVILIQGDREDAMVAALVGAYLDIPVLHFFGGDHASDGHVDNPVRHAVSKIATAHFVIHQSHVERLISIGEPQERIFLIGNPALDRFKKIPILSKKEVFESLGFSGWNEAYAVLVFHPILEERESAARQFDSILEVLKEKGIPAFVGYPNVDAGNRSIIHKIESLKEDKNFFFYRNLDRNIFVNLLRGAQFLIGNSSLGILEAPTLRLPAVNVGMRQRGRLHASNVVFSNVDVKSISESIDQVLEPSFRKALASLESPFGDANASQKFIDILESQDFKKMRYKKEDPLV